MARRRTARQIRASRANLVKARRRRRYAKGAAVVGAAAVIGAGAYATRTHVREGALRKKHGEDYIARNAKYHHYTKPGAARKIAKTKTWKPTGKHTGHGHKDGVWLTTGKRDGTTRDVFGKARVTTRLKRKEVLGAKTHNIPGGLSAGRDKRDKGVHHVQVHKSLMNGRKVKTNLPKTVSGTRRRVAGNLRRANADPDVGRKMVAYVAARNTAVNPARAAIKRRVRRK